MAGCGQLVGLADQIDMGWFTSKTETDMKGTLSADERMALAKLESTVDAGVQATLTVIEAGKALAEIRNRQLYRDGFTTWENYVTTRFKITRRRADQMCAFAGVQAALEETGTRVPELSEKAARHLVGMDADTMAAVVAEAAESPEGITAGSITKAAGKRKKTKAKAPRPRRFKVPGAVVVVEFNRKATLSVIEALQAAIRQAEIEFDGQAEAA